jgi:hypothetical protein
VKYFYKYFSTGATNSFEGTGLGLLVSKGIHLNQRGQSIGGKQRIYVDTEVQI